MDDHIVGWMLLISPKNNERMLFGGLQYICWSRYVTGRQQQGRRGLEEEG
jgi:hypothetical protein